MLDTQAHGRGVAIAWQIDEARHEAAVGVAADEEPGLPALRHLVDRQGHRGKVGGLDLEELLARIGLEELHDLLARVRARIDVELRHHLVDSRAQDGDLPHGLRVHRRGVDPEESSLPDHAPRLVEALDSDVVEIRGAVHGRTTVGRREHEDARLARASRHELAEVPGGACVVGV